MTKLNFLNCTYYTIATVTGFLLIVQIILVQFSEAISYTIKYNRSLACTIKYFIGFCSLKYSIRKNLMDFFL